MTQRICVRVQRKELTSINNGLDKGESIVVCFVKKEPIIYSARMDVDLTLLTFAFTDEEVDLRRQGLPPDKFTLDKEQFKSLFKSVLSGKNVTLSKDKDIRVKEVPKKNGSPVLFVEYTRCPRG